MLIVEDLHEIAKSAFTSGDFNPYEIYRASADDRTNEAGRIHTCADPDARNLGLVGRAV